LDSRLARAGVVFVVPIAFLREQAAKCRRLAHEVGDRTTAERLETLGREYDARADAQENDLRNIAGGTTSPDT
jgi:hypothetical protein